MATTATLPGCAVCRKTFKYGDDPHLLPCLHSICTNCLNNDKILIECPRCDESYSKQEHIFYKDTVTKADILISTAQNYPTQIKCSNKPHRNIAHIWCTDCQTFYCKPCQSAHSSVKSSNTHDIVMVKELANVQTLTTRSICPEHDTYLLDLYDVTCEILICSKCARGEHKQCQTEELEETSFQDDKKVLLEEKLKVDVKLQNVVKDLEYINDQRKDSEVMKQQMKQDIASHFDNLRQFVTQRKHELLKAVDVCFNTVDRPIKKTNTALDVQAERLQVVSDYIQRLSGYEDPGGFLVLKNNVKSRAELCLTKEVEILNLPNVAFKLSDGEMDNLKSIISGFGEIDYTWDVKSIYEHIDISASDTVPDARANAEEDTGDEQEDDTIYTDALTPAWPGLRFHMEYVNTTKTHITVEDSVYELVTQI